MRSIYSLSPLLPSSKKSILVKSLFFFRLNSVPQDKGQDEKEWLEMECPDFLDRRDNQGIEFIVATPDQSWSRQNLSSQEKWKSNCKLKRFGVIFFKMKNEKWKMKKEKRKEKKNKKQFKNHLTFQ